MFWTSSFPLNLSEAVESYLHLPRQTTGADLRFVLYITYTASTRNIRRLCMQRPERQAFWDGPASHRKVVIGLSFHAADSSSGIGNGFGGWVHHSRSFRRNLNRLIDGLIWYKSLSDVARICNKAVALPAEHVGFYHAML
jgi:hypothetical protein